MKVGENPKMPYPQCGRSIKTYVRGNNDAPSITKYGSPARLDAQIVALRPQCARTALKAPPLCAPPWVCTAFCVYRLAYGPRNNMTPAVGLDRLLCAPPCVCTAFCVYRLACGPLNNMTLAVGLDRLLCALPWVCTAFCVNRLACGPLNNMTPTVAIDRLLCALRVDCVDCKSST